MLLRQPDFETGENELYRPARHGDLEATIPLGYDYEYGGWWIDYLAAEAPTPQHQDLLSSYQADLSTECNSDSMAECKRAMYTESVADETWRVIAVNNGVKETVVSFDDNALDSAPGTIIVARHQDKRQVTGLK